MLLVKLRNFFTTVSSEVNTYCKVLKSVNVLLYYHPISNKVAPLVGKRITNDVNILTGPITEHLVRT